MKVRGAGRATRRTRHVARAGGSHPTTTPLAPLYDVRVVTVRARRVVFRRGDDFPGGARVRDERCDSPPGAGGTGIREAGPVRVGTALAGGSRPVRRLPRPVRRAVPADGLGLLGPGDLRAGDPRLRAPPGARRRPEGAGGQHPRGPLQPDHRARRPRLPGLPGAPDPAGRTGRAVRAVRRARDPGGRAVLGRPRGLAVGIAYGLSWGIQRAVEFDFHEIAFAVPLLAFALEAVLARRWRAALLWGCP